MKKGTLFLVPTPIGNLADITYRAVEVLKQVDMIAAEDTRVSGKLLKHYQIDTKMISYHRFNEKKRVEELLDKLNQGKDIALISDAGTPGISDPAAFIIQAALDDGVEVQTLPGATALIPALVSSGFSTQRFVFVGFVPEKKKDRDNLFAELKDLKMTLVFYEAPHRLVEFLKLLRKNLGNRRVCLAREISKKFETQQRETLDALIQNPEKIVLKGEFVVVIEAAEERDFSDEELMEKIRGLKRNGLSNKDIAAKISKQDKVAKNRVYDLVHKEEK